MEHLHYILQDNGYKLKQKNVKLIIDTSSLVKKKKKNKN